MRDVKLWAHRESAPGHLRFIRTAPAEAGRRRGERDPGSRQRRFVRQRGLDRRKSSKAWRFSKTAGRKRLLQSLRQTLKRHYGDRLLPIDVKPAACGANSRPRRRRPAETSRRRRFDRGYRPPPRPLYHDPERRVALSRPARQECRACAPPNNIPRRDSPGSWRALHPPCATFRASPGDRT
jgi:hypothetical protein